MRLFTKNNKDYSLGFTFKMLTTVEVLEQLDRSPEVKKS